MIRALFVAVTVVAVSLCASPTASADPMADLWGWLPKGFGPDNCQPEGYGDRSGMTAFIRCRASTEPDGPSGANFATFVNMEALIAQFNHMLDIMGPVTCPGGSSPKPVKTPKGLMACGMEPDGPRIMVTDNSDPPLMETFFGPSLEALMDWLGLEFKK